MYRAILCAASAGLLLLAGCPKTSKPKPATTHAIAGTVTRAWGGALPAVSVALGGAATATATTDASGRYSFTGLGDGSYTVTPSLASWAFAPAAPTVVVSGADRTQDFSADGVYAITGSVSGPGMEGVTVALSGEGIVKPDAVSAAGTGAYSFAGIPNGSYTLTASKAGYALSPWAPAVLVNGANATQDFTTSAARNLRGTVRDGGGSPLSGMTVRLTGERAVIATTAADGTYAFTALVEGAGYTVTPATFGYTFDPADAAPGPASRSYTLTTDVTDADFGGNPAGLPASTCGGSVSYGGTRTGPVYVTITGSSGGGNPSGGTGLARQAGPWTGRAFTIRNVPSSGSATVRAWMDTLGTGAFNAGADPSATIGVGSTGSPCDLGLLTLQDPPAPTVASPISLNRVVAGDGIAVVVFEAPRNADGAPLADAYRVYWNTSATVDAAHTLGTVIVPAGTDLGLVHGLTNGTGYWFRVEAWLGAAPLAGQSAVSASASTPAVPTGSATVTGTVAHGAVAAPSALYVVAQAAKGTGGVWFARFANPAGTQTDYALLLPPGTYELFSFIDEGDDGALHVGEPALFPDRGVPVVTLTAGANAGPTITIPSGDASASLRTSVTADAFGSWVDLSIDVASDGKVPLTAVVTGPGLRGPLDLGLNPEGGGIGVTLDATRATYPILPAVGDDYAMEVTYTDGTSETFVRPVTGLFAGPPGVVAPPDGAAGVAVVPTFEWTAPPGGTVHDYALSIWPQAGGDWLWEGWLPATQTSVAYDADGTAATSSLAPFTDYGWELRASDAQGNDATFRAGFTTGADVPPLYDLLDGTTLDGALWQTPQFTRSIAGGVAILSVQADGMEARTVQGTTYTNPVAVLASGQRVTTLGATVSVPAATAARSGTAILIGGIRIIYQPSANRGPLFPAGNMNVLSAMLELYASGEELQLRRRFHHCDDAACVSYGGSGITVVDPVGFTVSGTDATAPAAWDTPYAVELSLDEATKTFTWKVQGGAYSSPLSGTADVSTWVASVGMTLGTSNNGFLNAQLYTRVSDESGGSSARVAASYDDVRVGFNGAAAGLWDDFSSGGFSPAKWGAVDSDVWMAGGSLHLASAVTTAADGAFSENTNVLAMYPAMFRSWQADVAIVADSPAGVAGSADGAGIVGAFYNDGTAGTGAIGDVRARVSLETASASWSIFRCTTVSCGPTTPIASGPLTPSLAHPLGLGTLHTLSIRWDAGARLFTFGLDDAPSAQAPVTTVGSATPRYPFHMLTTGVTVGSGATAGASASVEATFDNVRGAAP